jgi:tRNA threonylcarbamoyladenosine biosynthesis protein TsaE
MAKIKEKSKRGKQETVSLLKIFTAKEPADFCLPAVFLAKASGGRGLIALYGDLGSGKTTLVRFLGKELKVKGLPNSPTFNILKTYSFPRGKTLYHLDFYRLKTPQEILDLGFKEWFLDKNGLLVVEWPEILGEHLPAPRLEVRIDFKNESREIKIFRVTNC